MKRCLPLLLLSLLCWVARAQSPVVPNYIYFADMKLEIQENARTEIQKIVDGLTRHPAYFQKKVELADAYFPFIEQTFEQEGVPTDFKYLVLQESGLVSDAVSTSNAVGFWQFKEGSATELGIKVNSQVDERKHIIVSSRGAAKYLLRSNVYYQNWFNSLLSYYQGLTGTKALTKTSDIGVKTMQVDEKTNKYLLTFLAHKVAYENAIGKNPTPALSLQPVKAAPGQTLTEIAMQAQADVLEVERYNKWLLASTIPADKEYTVLIPQLGGATRPILAQAPGPIRKETGSQPESKDQLKSISAKIKAIFTTSNSLKSIVAQPGDTKDMLALQAGISTRKFLKYNDMRSFDEIVPGQTYYLQAKKTKASTDYHVARSGETMHSISQKYGVKLNKLLSKNRMKRTEALVSGRVVWLQQTRPRNISVEIRRIEENLPPATATEVVAQKSETTSVQPTPVPVKPKAGAITIEVEDTTTAPYVPVVPQEKQDSATLIPSSGMYPAKTIANQPKPAPPLERKAPEQGVLVAKIETPAQNPMGKSSISTATSHVVEKGETLYSISRHYNVAMEDLLAWNKLDGSAPLAVGQELSLAEPSAAETIKAPVATKPATSEHIVTAGETLYSISRKYGISIQDLQTWNNVGSGSLSIGQKLVVVASVATVSKPRQPETPAPSTNLAPTKPVAGMVTHQVATGESMYQISRKYGVTIKDIMEWNNKADFNVTVGESLLIKPKQ